MHMICSEISIKCEYLLRKAKQGKYIIVADK